MRITGIAERLAYWPSRDPFITPPGYEDVTFQTQDGLTLHGWFMPARGATEPAPAVLHAHGNAGNISHHAEFSSFLTQHGFSVLVFDYRAYGRSDKGRLKRNKLLIDARAALDYLRSREDTDPDRIGVYGVSLGGAFALPLAAENENIRAVATLSTFSTWRGVAHDWLPFLGPVIFPPGLEPEDAVKKLGDRPLLIVHGDRDEVINIRHTHRLKDAAEAASVPANTYISAGSDHNNVVFDDPEARRRIAEFFTQHLAR